MGDSSDYILPEIFNEGYLPVGDGHELYYVQSGNPEGIAVIYLPGGPIKEKHRRFFGAENKSADVDGRFHVIQFDQRGCGKSRPLGGL
jgi:proline iminopeptidase